LMPIILLEICAAHESLRGPERRLLRDSNMSGVGGKAEVLCAASKRRV